MNSHTLLNVNLTSFTIMEDNDIRKHERSEFPDARSSYLMPGLIRLICFIALIVLLIAFCACYDVRNNKRKRKSQTSTRSSTVLLESPKPRSLKPGTLPPLPNESSPLIKGLNPNYFKKKFGSCNRFSEARHKMFINSSLASKKNLRSTRPEKENKDCCDNGKLYPDWPDMATPRCIGKRKRHSTKPETVTANPNDKEERHLSRSVKVKKNCTEIGIHHSNRYLTASAISSSKKKTRLTRNETKKCHCNDNEKEYSIRSEMVCSNYCPNEKPNSFKYERQNTRLCDPRELWSTKHERVIPRSSKEKHNSNRYAVVQNSSFNGKKSHLTRPKCSFSSAGPKIAKNDSVDKENNKMTTPETIILNCKKYKTGNLNRPEVVVPSFRFSDNLKSNTPEMVNDNCCCKKNPPLNRSEMLDITCNGQKNNTINGNVINDCTVATNRHSKKPPINNNNIENSTKSITSNDILESGGNAKDDFSCIIMMNNNYLNKDVCPSKVPNSSLTETEVGQSGNYHKKSKFNTDRHRC